MTEKQIEKMGFENYSTKIHPYRFYLHNIGWFDFSKYHTQRDIILKVYDIGLDVGKDLGRVEKIEEIKAVLNIEE